MMKRILAALIFLAGLAEAQVTITGVSVSVTGSSTATVTWNTSSGATTQVLYGLNGSLSQQTTLIGSLTTTHSVDLSGLSVRKVYSYAARSQTAGGLVTTSSTFTFMLCGSSSEGRTQVTGNINTAYEYGRYSIAWVNDSGQVTSTPTVCGQTFTTTQTGTLDYQGNLSITLPDNNAINPSPGHWSFTISGIDGTIGQFVVSKVITGNTQDISTDLQAAASNQLQHVYYDPTSATFLPGISGSGTVTSVALSTTATWLTVTGSPITGGGTFNLNPTGGLTANQVLATPDSSTGALSVRSLVVNDLPITGSGTGTKYASAGFINPASNKCVEVDSSGNLQIAGTNAACGSGGGGGGVSSVGLALPAGLFTVTNSPVTTSGTLTGTFASVAAHTFLGNNTSGASVAALVQPAFTDLSGSATTAQLPFTYGTSNGSTKLATIGATWTGSAGAGICLDANLNLTTTGCTAGTVTAFNGRTGAVTPATNDYTLAQISATFSSPLSLSTSTLSCPTCVTSASALTANAVVIGGGSQASQTISTDTTTTHALFATAGAPAFRALASTDIPNLDASKITTGILATAVGGTANGFFTVSGPATSAKTFTFPNASATVLTSNAAVTVPQGGTGAATLAAHGVLIGEGTSTITVLAAASADTVLMGQGVSGDPAFAALTSCSSAANAVTYNTTTHAFGCNTIAGSGTVNTGTTGKLSYYASNGTAVSPDTSSTDGSGNLTATSFSTAGATAGIVLLGQGTAQSLGTTAIGFTAPTSVTSYNFVFPGTAGSGYLKYTNATNVVTGVFEAAIDVTADITGIVPSANGGTNNGFTAFSGPASTTKTFTLPNASASILTDNALVTVPQGGTGRSSLTNHGVLVGAAASAVTQLAAGATGTVFTGQGASADPSFSTTATLGIVGTANGIVVLNGSTSGAVTIQPQAAAGTYNFNLPTGAGTSGQPLLSGGGTTNPMTFGTLGLVGGGLGITSGTSGGIPYFSGTSTIASSAALTAHGVVIGGGAATAPTSTTAGTSGFCLLSNGASSDPTFQACPTGGNPAFSSVTSGTNSTAAMVVGTGASLAVSGTGTILATNAGGAGVSFAGSSSGATVVAATAVAGSTTLTLPAATDTLVGKATTDALTNKTINGLTPTALATGFSLAGGTTSKTLTVSNTMTLAGTDASTYTFPAASATMTQTIASGTSALGTSAITSGACATVVTTTATNTATTDDIMADFNADPTAVTGYSPSANGMLTIIKYPTANNVNFKVCNNTASSITPGAITLNWRVVR